uniref:Uncharacterized protein n=1 Tax=Mesocestoides corti TaxID=53468 RepID=A0A5K3FBH5_MESCO
MALEKGVIKSHPAQEKKSQIHHPLAAAAAAAILRRPALRGSGRTSGTLSLSPLFFRGNKKEECRRGRERQLSAQGVCVHLFVCLLFLVRFLASSRLLTDPLISGARRNECSAFAFRRDANPPPPHPAPLSFPAPSPPQRLVDINAVVEATV